MGKPNFISSYFSTIGKRGGNSRSPAKIKASRLNAAKAAAARRKNGNAKPKQ